MATLALESRPGRFDQLIRLLAPFPGRLEFAARVAAICALTALVVEIYQTPDAALTTYVVFFLNRPERTASVILSVAFILIMTVVIGVVFLIAMVVIDYPSWRVASMAALSLGLLFLASASKLRPVGATMTLIAAYALDLLGSVPGGEAATRGLLYAWLFVGIPAAVSIAVSLVLAPSPGLLCERALARRLRLAAAMLRAPDEETRREFTEHLREGNGEIEKRLRLALVEKSASPEQVEALRRAAESSFEIISLIDVADRDPDIRLPSAQRERLALALKSLACKSYAADASVTIDCGDAVAAEPPFSPGAAEIVSRMKGAIAVLAGTGPKSMSQGQRAHAPPPAPEAKASSGFFLPDAFTNPDHVRYALKTTAAAMFCYVTYSLLDWSGIHTSFLTCYIVSLQTTAETLEKLTLRIAGCLVGSLAGYAAIVFLTPSLTSIGDLMTVVFFGALASAWVSAGSARISYAGLQIAFAFFLCVIQGSSPSFDLETARDRIIGIFFGISVVYLVFTNISPISVAKRIDRRIAEILRRMAVSLATVRQAPRGAELSELQQMLGFVEEDVDMARYEPMSIRPAEEWLAHRRRLGAELGAIFPVAWLAFEDDPVLAPTAEARFNRLADRLSLAESVQPPPVAETVAQPETVKDLPQTAPHPFGEALEKGMKALEELVWMSAETRDQRAADAPP